MCSYIRYIGEWIDESTKARIRQAAAGYNVRFRRSWKPMGIAVSITHDCECTPATTYDDVWANLVFGAIW